MRNYVLAGTIAAALVGAYALLRSPVSGSGEQPLSAAQPAAGAEPTMVSINVPDVEGNAAIGKEFFEKTCAVCHGANAAGKEGSGPPLIHVIYEPSHHADEAFQRAVAMGVKSHHWRFGDMPKIEGLTRGDVSMIIAYIREVQRANGIN